MRAKVCAHTAKPVGFSRPRPSSIQHDYFVCSRLKHAETMESLTLRIEQCAYKSMRADTLSPPHAQPAPAPCLHHVHSQTQHRHPVSVHHAHCQLTAPAPCLHHAHSQHPAPAPCFHHVHSQLTAPAPQPAPAPGTGTQHRHPVSKAREQKKIRQ